MGNVIEAESVVGKAQESCHCVNGVMHALDLTALKVDSSQNKLKLEQQLHHLFHVEEQKVHNAKHVCVEENVANQIQQFVGVQQLLGVAAENVTLQFAHYVGEVSVLIDCVEHQRSTQSEQGKRISLMRIFAQWETKAQLGNVEGWPKERKHGTAHYAGDT